MRNKSSILGKIQTVEYASIIGSIKRAQTLNGYVNTISGVFTLFRKSALEAVGYWDDDMITEDIAVSWKFHMHHYEIRYEPRALCWMLVPETFTGIWKQRLRWAQGGHEVVLREFKSMLKQPNLPLWLLYLEQLISIIWVYSVLFLLAFTIINIDVLDYYFYAYAVTLISTYSFFIYLFHPIILQYVYAYTERFEGSTLLFMLFSVLLTFGACIGVGSLLRTFNIFKYVMGTQPYR
ncbi:glycosyltransferase family 2 protein [Macrococcoides caseolyticum]|uniref:glycosyltransferase family 2 protein n=1 Tax=Macrococcoides caseolyticum TaxID=69966 RepID=UPI0039C8D1E8